MAGLEIGEPLIRNFEPREYDGHSQIWTITEDGRGVMYFGSWQGLIEFDGTNWRKIEMPGDSTARVLIADASGRILVGGIHEFGYLAPAEDGLMAYISLNNKIPKDNYHFKDVWHIFITSHGTYFITKKETFRWFDNTVTILPIGCGRPIKMEDKILYFTEKGFALLESGKIEYLPGDWDPEMDFEYTRTFPYHDGEQIVVNERGHKPLLYSYKQPADSKGRIRLQEFRNQVGDFFIQHRIYTVTVLGSGNTAFGTDAGIVILDANGDLVQVINENRGLLNNYVHVIFEDRLGNLWVGMQGGISHIITSSPLTVFGKKAGITSTITAVTRHNGTIWAGSYSAGPLMLPPYKLKNENDIHSFISPEGEAKVYGWHFLAMDETLLVASEMIRTIKDGKIADIEGTPIAYNFCKSKRFKNRIFLGIAEPSGGGVGVLEFSTDESGELIFDYKGKLEGIKEIVQAVDEDRDGNLWLSSTHISGLIKLEVRSEALDDFEITRYSTEQGLPAETRNAVYLNGDRVMIVTKKGFYEYVGSNEKYSESKLFAPLQEMNLGLGEITEDITQIIKLNDEDWLISPISEYGFLTRSSEETLEIDSRPFRAMYGQRPGIHIDPDGVFWIPSGNGLFRYDSKKQKDYDVSFAAIIRKVKTNLDREIFGGTYYDPDSKTDDHYVRTTLSQPKAQIPTLRYNENGLTFEFSALFYEHMDRVTYQVMLDGFEDRWSEWSTKTLKEYTNIHEGSYTFKVRANNIYDTVSSEATYQFKILPPWYRTVWAYAGYLAVFILLMFVGIRLYSRRLLAQKKRLEGIVKERTAEIVKQKDQIEEARNALWGEMELAKKIQTVLLPEDPKIPGYEITGYMQTAAEVGGDYYDVINVEGKNWIIIGDVSGHGVPAGLVMMMVQTAINQVLIGRSNESPETILARVNQNIYRNIQKLGESKYMTITLLSVEPDGNIYYSGLHQDIMVYRKAQKSLELANTHGIWLGVTDDIEGMNEVDSIKLDQGDVMLLFTDGIVEATNSKNEMYSHKKLQSVFKECGDQSTEEIRDCILKSLEGYSADDDVTMVVVMKS